MNTSFGMAAFSLLMLKSVANKFGKGTEKGVKVAMDRMESDAKTFSGANQVQVKSGYLKNSIKTRVTKSPTGNIVGVIGSSAIYAAIHEFGGLVQAGGSYMTFKGDFGWRKASSVLIPKRPFLKPAVERNRKSMKSNIIKSINTEIR